ncbi:MAG: sel1 repeat family protein [Clostridia bacterium]|nr:sel1 repeat family protein [Clostridia bacterium]
MICRECGYEWNGTGGDPCPACGCFSDGAAAEALYTRGIQAEKQKKYRAACDAYAKAADLGVPLAAYAVCRCLEKSGARQAAPDLYEFWLSHAARSDGLAAAAYAAYLRRMGDEQGALLQLRRAADMGHDASALRVARYYFLHGNRPAARYYLARLPLWRGLLMRLAFLGKQGEMPPSAMETPDNSVELYAVGKYAQEKGLPHIAYTYFESAAEMSYLPAVEMAATLCMRGEGTERDEDKVVRYLTELGESGNTAAYIRLGDYYMNGLLYGAPDPRAARQAYLLAAERKDPAAIVLLADCLLDGIGGERLPREALALYDEAARLGSCEGAGRAERMRKEADAAFGVARTLAAEGKHTEAVSALTPALEIGHTGALCLLGDLTLSGRGMKPSPRDAAALYERAAEAGDARAAYRLGVLTGKNHGVRYDAARARDYLGRAKAAGIEGADAALEELDAREKKRLARKVYARSCVAYHRGDRKEAARLRLLAARMGNARATFLLGCMYDCGDGVPQDATRAKALYGQAHIRGFDGKRNGFMSKYLRNLMA